MSIRIRPDYRLLTALLVTLSWSASYAADGWDINGQHGELHVTGVLQEAPCLLAMRSTYQAINLDSSALANLQKTGDTGQPQQIIFHMRGCKTATGDNQALNREATVRFLSQADADEPTLFLLQGVSGIALRLEDSNGRMVIPGERKAPLFQPATNDLIYKVVPVRTKAPLSTGEFRATVDFGMSYE